MFKENVFFKQSLLHLISCLYLILGLLCSTHIIIHLSTLGLDSSDVFNGDRFPSGYILLFREKCLREGIGAVIAMLSNSYVYNGSNDAKTRFTVLTVIPCSNTSHGTVPPLRKKKSLLVCHLIV